MSIGRYSHFKRAVVEKSNRAYIFLLYSECKKTLTSSEIDWIFRSKNPVLIVSPYIGYLPKSSGLYYWQIHAGGEGAKLLHKQRTSLKSQIYSEVK